MSTRVENITSRRTSYTNGSRCAVPNPGSAYLHWYHEENISCTSLSSISCLYIGIYISGLDCSCLIRWLRSRALKPGLIRFFFHSEQCFPLTNSSKFLKANGAKLIPIPTQSTIPIILYFQNQHKGQHSSAHWLSRLFQHPNVSTPN